MKRFLIAAAGAALLSSCVGSTQKSLILYYSQTGATEKVAAELQKQTGADIEKFDVTEAYGGDYQATIKRVSEEREKGIVHALAPISSDLKKYDVIYLAYPIWFGTYAPPVKALINEVNLDGKKIVPVCTFGSGGLEASIEELKKALPASEIADGFGIRNARIQYAEEELNRFLIENGYKEGQIDPLPEYSAQDVVTPEELAAYTEATAAYPFPMGAPVSVGSRTVPGGVDYLFTVQTASPDGSTGEGKVFVSRRNGRPVEFTKVVR